MGDRFDRAQSMEEKNYDFKKRGKIEKKITLYGKIIINILLENKISIAFLYREPIWKYLHKHFLKSGVFWFFLKSK
jgi:hypothetical protein